MLIAQRKSRYKVVFVKKNLALDLKLASPSSVVSVPPGSANAAALPGSRSRGGSCGMIHIWPNPLPLEYGVIRLQQEKLAAGIKGGHATVAAAGGQKFPLKVSSA